MTGVEDTWTFYEGRWHAGNVRIMGPRTHGAWLGSSVFDGARAFGGATPDIDLHCRRVNASAAKLLLEPVVEPAAWLDLVRAGLARFAAGAELYIRPMYWAERSGPSAVAADPASTSWCLSLYTLPMPTPGHEAITLSPFRKPTIETMPADAKSGCLYPNNGRAVIEARSRGFDNCVMLDHLGNVAELASANIFIGRGGVVYTPVPNGTFLDGITRRRVIFLLREAGVPVVETTLTYAELERADEIFSTGNFGKVMPITRIDFRTLPHGSLYQAARALYRDFAKSGSVGRP